MVEISVTESPGNTDHRLEEQAKERLAYVSGTIFVLGLFLLKVWPIASHLQTGSHIRPWSSARPTGEQFAFYALLMVVSIAVVTVMLSVVHILSWGLWLCVPENLGESTGTNRERFRKLSENSYSGIVLIFVTVVLSVPLIPVFWAGLALMVSVIHAPLYVGGFIVALIYTVFFTGVMWRIVRKSKGWEVSGTAKEWLEKQLNLGFFLGVITCGVLLAAKEAACTIEFRASGQVFLKSEPKTIEIITTLGGATSDPSVAILTLKDSSGNILRELEKVDLGNDNYVSFIATRDLIPGRYLIVLEYPHSSFIAVVPYLRLRTVKRSWFVIAP